MNRSPNRVSRRALPKKVFLILVIFFLLSSAWQKEQQARLLLNNLNIYTSHTTHVAPTDGYGVYESCEPSQGDPCLERLKQIADGGFKLVLNYDSVAGSAPQLLTYAKQAEAVGLKLIWAINAPRFWNGSTDLRHYYPALAATCDCSNNMGFLRYFINLIKNHAGTWGYYIGDEVEPSDHVKLKAFSDLVHRFDPDHPRLFIACGACSAYANVSPPYVASLLPMVDTADVVGADYYPIGSDGRSIANISEAAEAIQGVANAYGKGSAVVLQAFSFTQYNEYLECSPYPDCATFPTYDQMRTMRNLTLQYTHPRLVLWYSYYNIFTYDHASQHWADLVRTINK